MIYFYGGLSLGNLQSVHAKGAGGINSVTTLVNECGGPSETAFLSSFGALEQGKGLYDGVGEDKIDFAVSTTVKTKLGCTTPEYIHTVEEFVGFCCPEPHLTSKFQSAVVKYSVTKIP